LNKNEIFCVKVISFNPLARELYKYITKLLVFNLINLPCFNDDMIFLKKYLYGIDLMKGKFKTYFLMFEVNQIFFPSIVI